VSPERDPIFHCIPFILLLFHCIPYTLPSFLLFFSSSALTTGSREHSQ
jgi:hypothetical protein